MSLIILKPILYKNILIIDFFNLLIKMLLILIIINHLLVN